jgi:hypothetical protein
MDERRSGGRYLQSVEVLIDGSGEYLFEWCAKFRSDRGRRAGPQPIQTESLVEAGGVGIFSGIENT